MKLNKNEKTGTNTVELEIFIEPEHIKEASAKVYKRDAKRYNVPGFRKGKAPRNLIEKMYGDDVFTFDAVNDLFPDAYDEAIKEAAVEPVAKPDVEVVSLSAGEGAVLKAVLIVKPEMKLGKYTGLKAARTVGPVEEASVDEEIESYRERNSRMITREGKAQDGDIADIDFEGFVDDVAFEGGKGEGHRLTLGSGQFIPGFEEQVVGHTAGEAFDVNVTFPEEYHAEDLAGKKAVFKVKINEIQQKELPDADDELAKDVSDFDTLKELKDSIRERLQKQSEEKADLDVENQLVDQIVETLEGEIPEVMFESQVDDMVRNAAMSMEQQGLNLDYYLQLTQMSPADFRAGYREDAEKQVKRRLAFEAIVKKEGIEVLEADVEAEIDRIAEKYEMEKEQIRNLMPADLIKEDLALSKAIEFVKEKATITEKKAAAKKAETKPAAKKPAAKKPAEKKDADAKPAAEKKPAAKKPAAKKPAAKKADESK